MTDFLSKISGQIAGPIILGAFFPVLLFFTVLSLVVLPITPYGHQLTNLVRDPYHWQANGVAALMFTLALFAFTVVLYQLNVPLLRFYEGYPWKDSWVGKKRAERHERRFRLAQEMKARTISLARDADLEDVMSDLKPGSLIGLPDKCRQILEKEFPDKSSLILPTRLGNMIRAFETYTQRRYGASSIALWPRLQGIMEASFAQALDNTKMAFDFMLNCSFLSIVLAILLLGAGLWWRHPRYYGLLQIWELGVVVLLLCAYLLYLGAINRAGEWGLGVKAAFDLYRLPLLEKLGYTIKPESLEDERRIWDIISYHFAFPSDEIYPELPYKDPQTTLGVDPVATVITLRRTVCILANGNTQVRIVVANTDPTATHADSILLKEKIPAGKNYVNGSATLDGVPAVLSGLDPVSIQIGPLPYLQSRIVTYELSNQVVR